MSSHPTELVTDIVFLDALHLTATIGPDHWNRTRPQPIEVSLHLHFTPLYLDTPGLSDNVADSLHYGHLAKAVERWVGARAVQGYPSARALIDDVTNAAFEFAENAVGGAEKLGSVVRAVRVVLSLPKRILLAGGFELELTTSARAPSESPSEWVLGRSESAGSGTGLGGGGGGGAIARVTDLVLPVVIGVNPPERLAKQRVVTDLTFVEAAQTGTEDGDGEVDYPAIVQQIATDVERSTYLTLEKLAYEIIQTAYRASEVVCSNSDSDPRARVPRIERVTVRCRKPSALSFADASGVEMTRTFGATRR